MKNEFSAYAEDDILWNIVKNVFSYCDLSHIKAKLYQKVILQCTSNLSNF